MGGVILAIKHSVKLTEQWAKSYVECKQQK